MAAQNLSEGVDLYLVHIKNGVLNTKWESSL